MARFTIFKCCDNNTFKIEHFNPTSDTEVLLYLYERYGIGCLEKLNGDFALAILDERYGKLFLVRDRSGVKPLYYLDGPNLFAFASELKPLLKIAPGQPLDYSALGRFFVFKYVPGQDTLFANIRRIPPGHWLEYDLMSGSYTLHAYWRLEKKASYSTLKYSLAKETLLQMIQEAAQMQLVADVPVEYSCPEA